MGHKIQMEASLLVKDDCEHCLEELGDMLSHHRGINRVHLTSDPPKLCLHFDPDQVTVASVERMARDAGGVLEGRYQHQRFKILSTHSADSAKGLEKELDETPGVVHTSVNLAFSRLSIAYDSSKTDIDKLSETIKKIGMDVRTTPSSVTESQAHHDEEHDDHHHHHSGTWTLIQVVVAGLSLLLAWLGETFWGFPPNLALVLYGVSYIAGGYDISTHALPGLFRGRFDTDILMLAAAAGAAALGKWAEGAFLLFLFSLGHAGEHYALDRARNAIDALGDLMPTEALVQRGEESVTIPLDEVMVGDIALVRPGDRVPVDGTILSGLSELDQSPITGESIPVEKGPGDEVFAGTINLETSLEVWVEKLAVDSTLSRVIEMVSEAQEQKSPTQEFTQRFTSKFVPLTLLTTLLVIFVPPLIGVMEIQDSFYRAMLLLVATSPCALALGTPAAVLAGIAQAARNGVLIKGGRHLETLGSLKAMAFDKTGTLTIGRPTVVEMVTADGVDEGRLLEICGSVEQQSNHPIAVAIVNEARKRGLELRASESLENLPGLGVQSELDDRLVWIGSRKLFIELDQAPTLSSELQASITDLEERGRTIVITAHGDEVLGVIALIDTPREEAKQTLKTLRRLDLKHLVMLTGDNSSVAQAVASEVGLDEVDAELMPKDKWQAIGELRKAHGTIAMVGDGVNDAPALAAADVGIAMGGAGTAVALETADVALMGDKLSRLPFAIGLSRQSRLIIKQNLFIAFGVIVLLVITSLSGYGELGPIVVVHEGSTLVVVANALRLLAYKGPKDTLAHEG